MVMIPLMPTMSTTPHIPGQQNGTILPFIVDYTRSDTGTTPEIGTPLTWDLVGG